MGEELRMEQTSPFWANVSAVAVSPVAITVGVVMGSYDAANGTRRFDEGFYAAAEPIVAAAKGFGAKHGEAITKGIVGGAATALGARILNEVLRGLRR
jgi:hypothetical protein